MLQVLVESRAPRARRVSFTAVSIAVHATLIAAAALLTARMEAPPRVERAEHIVYAAPAPAPAHAAATPLSAAASLVIAAPSFAMPQLSTPAITLPSSDVFSRVLEELGATSIGSPIGTRTGGSVPGQIHTAQTVDRIVAPLPGNPSPPYPTRLSNAGVEGEVLARFVVDTTGRVEAPTIEIQQASHALFGEAVRRWLTQTRYSPAIAGGRPVRQLVQQRIGFTLTR